MTLQERLNNISKQVLKQITEQDCPAFEIKGNNLQLNKTAIVTLKMLGGERTLNNEKNKLLIFKGIDNSISFVLTSSKELFGIRAVNINSNGKAVLKKTNFLRILEDAFPKETNFTLSEIVVNEELLMAAISNSAPFESTIEIEIEDSDTDVPNDKDTPTFIRTAEGIENLALEQEALEEIKLDFEFSMEELEKTN